MDTNNTPLSVLKLAALRQAQFAAFMENCGHTCITTFYADLTIAEHYGAAAVRETYNRINAEWRGNYQYYSEFVVCLNNKIWEHYGEGENDPRANMELARVYDELWRAADEWAGDNFKGEAARYYFNLTD